MTYNHFYLAANIPQWGIFIGIVCVIVGYVEKKDRWMTAGWIVLILTGLTSLAFNVFSVMEDHSAANISPAAIASLRMAGWQTAIGGFVCSRFLFRGLNNRFVKILAVLTIIYFMLIFFQFNHVMRSKSENRPSIEKFQS